MPGLGGEGHRGDVVGPEHGPQDEEDDGGGHHGAVAHHRRVRGALPGLLGILSLSGALRPSRVRCGLGGALAEEPQSPEQLHRHAAHPARGHRQERRRAQGRGQYRAENEGHLVQGRLQGEGRVNLLGAGEHRRPASAHQ